MDQNYNGNIQQLPPVDKKCKHSYEILGMDQIHIQDQQSVRKNNKDTPKMEKKLNIRWNSCKR